MIKTVALVSLSRGLLGEPFIDHELELGLSRLEAMGLSVKIMPNALAGLDYLAQHPEARAEDLLAAFRDEEVDLILCAIGGDDTYRLLPYLFEHDQLKKVLSRKAFLGFSDSTVNHLMLHRLGLPSYYGQSFLVDLCELEPEMLPYSFRCFSELIRTGRISEIVPADRWYESRTDFSPAALGTRRVSHPNEGFQLLQGPARFSGKILGGCLDTLFDLFDNSRYADSVSLCARYGLFPTMREWEGRILLLETSEELMPPEKYEDALYRLKAAGVFEAVSGVLVGRPVDYCHDSEYKEILLKVIDDPKLPVLANLDIGHAAPHCIIPFGVQAFVDAEQQRIRFEEN